MSSFDIRSVVNDMAIIRDAHVDKIFQWGFNVLFRVNVQGYGKKDVFFKEKKWLYMPKNKPQTPVDPQSFAMFLRKYLDNARIGDIEQVGFDRIVTMNLLKSGHNYQVIFEIFGGGNVLFVENGKILNCLVHKTMKDRNVRPGENYVIPVPRFDPTSSSFSDFAGIIKSSVTDAVRTLATGINLGGQYAEEVCTRSNIEKNTPVDKLSDDDLLKLYDKVKEIVAQMMNCQEAMLYRSECEIVDISPIEMSIYSHMKCEKFETISKAIDQYMIENAEAESEEYIDPEIIRLRKRIEKQTETVEQYKQDAAGYKKKADVIYTNYQQIKELLNVFNQQSRKLTWEKLKEGAMKISFVSSIEPSKNLVTAVFENVEIPLDYTKNVDANASDLYEKGKEIGKKAIRANDALEESVAVLKKKEAGMIKTKAMMTSGVQPTKQFWFDRYKWFITPSGRLVIAGKDAHTNDNIVKKHMKDNDIYAHTDIHGAPSTILKDGLNASDEDLRETCIYALAQSKGWVAALTDGSAYWVYTDQVSKTPQAGEFVPRGAFIIRGKRNYEYHLPMEIAVGEIMYENSKKIMCSPLESMKKLSKKYFIIKPGRGKSGKTAAQIAEELRVPEEEVSRILPPGDSEIVLKVWSDE
ncbi:MAG: NFACT family protein [archaeon]|nr:NFACT family protein [archaeon]